MKFRVCTIWINKKHERTKIFQRTLGGKSQLKATVIAAEDQIAAATLSNPNSYCVVEVTYQRPDGTWHTYPV